MNALNSKTKRLLEASAEMYEPTAKDRAKVDARVMGALATMAATTAAATTTAIGAAKATGLAGAKVGAGVAATSVTASVAVKIAATIAIAGALAAAGMAVVHETRRAARIEATFANAAPVIASSHVAIVATGRATASIDPVVGNPVIDVKPSRDPIHEDAPTAAVTAPVAAPIVHTARIDAPIPTASSADETPGFTPDRAPRLTDEIFFRTVRSPKSATRRVSLRIARCTTHPMRSRVRTMRHVRFFVSIRRRRTRVRFAKRARPNNRIPRITNRITHGHSQENSRTRFERRGFSEARETFLLRNFDVARSRVVHLRVQLHRGDRDRCKRERWRRRRGKFGRRRGARVR
jgi:hypothetical protein